MNTNAFLEPAVMEYIDAPATTSPVTYEPFWKVNGGNAYLGRRAADTTIDVASILTVEEIR